MPNPRNVDAPMTLVGPGRAGTTLVTAIFGRHPDFSVVGESSHLVWSSYFWQHRWLRNTGPFTGGRTMDEVARDGVHGMLCATYPAEEPRWFHKPIFQPFLAEHFADRTEFSAWYWEASRMLFPRGRFFTVVRDPAANAASIMQRWDNTEEQAFLRLERLFEMMLHPDSRVELVVPFEALQERPEETVRRLMQLAGTEPHPDQMKAFGRSHAVNSSGERPTGLKTPAVVQDLYERLLDRADPALRAAEVQQ